MRKAQNEEIVNCSAMYGNIGVDIWYYEFDIDYYIGFLCGERGEENIVLVIIGIL